MNYQHLLYFRAVAVAGGITSAARRLRLTPPTLSAQVRVLEEALGTTLFERNARGMTLTEDGHVVLRYADRIFALGDEMKQALHARTSQALRVGIELSSFPATVQPLLVALGGGAALAGGEASERSERVVCSFSTHEELLSGLKSLELDLVLASVGLALAPDLASRLVSETAVAFFGNNAAVKSLREGFPQSLHGASFIAPPKSSLRNAVERWLEQKSVRLSTNVELGDASLAASLAADGVGLIVAPVSAGAELRKRYELSMLGVVDGVCACIHATAQSGRLEHLVAALLQTAAPPAALRASGAR